MNKIFTGNNPDDCPIDAFWAPVLMPSTTPISKDMFHRNRLVVPYSDPTDRELIEFAAKAAGKTRGEWDYDWLVGLGHEISRDMLWNPLADDGAALRLAVQLGLLFTYMVDRFDMFQRFYREELDRDLRPSEATRRAVTRAAYEIGKAMP